MSETYPFQRELFPLCADCRRAIIEHSFDEAMACWRVALCRTDNPYPDPPASPAWRIAASTVLRDVRERTA